MSTHSDASSLCWRCGHSSGSPASFCARCGQSLTVSQLDAGQLLRGGRAASDSASPPPAPLVAAPADPSAPAAEPDDPAAAALSHRSTNFEAWVGSRSFARMWSQFWRIVYREQQHRRTMPVEEYLATVPLFEDLSRGERRKLASIAHHREYAPGETIYESGTPCVAMFVIRSGAVSLLLPDGNGGETEVVRLGEGMFFDEIALHSEVPNWVTARSTAETELLAFPRTDMRRMAAIYPALGYKVLGKLTAILNLRLQLMAQMAFGGTD